MIVYGIRLALKGTDHTRDAGHFADNADTIQARVAEVMTPQRIEPVAHDAGQQADLFDFEIG